MKFLNLDKFTPETGRHLQIDGVNHPINAMGVGGFIDMNIAVKNLNTEDPVAQCEFTINTIISMVPTVKPEQLKKYTLDQLNTIAEFVRGADVEEAEDAAAAAEGTEGEQAGK